MENLNDCLNYLEHLHPLGENGIELGLSRVLAMKKALSQREFCPIVSIAGTNGKGSVAAFLGKIFECSGKKTGVYTSPHLLNFTERIAINGKNVSENDVVQAFLKVKRVKEQTGIALSYFEFMTLSAFEIFTQHQVERLVLEMGLGARLDAVNIYEPSIAILTSVGNDHQHFLGKTLHQIGWEKAHVFRKHKPALCGMEHPPQSVLDYAKELGAQLSVFQKDFHLTVENEKCHFQSASWQLETALPRIQTPLSNAALAVQVAHLLNVENKAIQEGIQNAQLKGRFEVVHTQPLAVADVAHNEEALIHFRQKWLQLEGAPSIAVLGMMKDKDLASALAVFKGVFDQWYCCTLDSMRAASAEMLAEQIRLQQIGGAVFLFDSVQKAWQRVLKKAPEGAKIAIFGSFHTVAGVMDCNK